MNLSNEVGDQDSEGFPSTWLHDLPYLISVEKVINIYKDFLYKGMTLERNAVW